jgi:hypothetical protein
MGSTKYQLRQGGRFPHDFEKYDIPFGDRRLAKTIN